MPAREQIELEAEKSAETASLCPGLQAAIRDGEDDGAVLASQIAADAVAARATDIHIDPAADGFRVGLRIDGVLHSAIEMDRESGEALTRAIEVDAGIEPATGFDRFEGTSHFGPADTPLRVASVRTVQGAKLSLRLLEVSQIHHDVRTLGMRPQDEQGVLAWADRSEGMMLCVGPTGCGKTTTCYALLNEMKKERRRNILTLEDPVEFTLDGLNQVRLDASDGSRPDTFAEGVRALLRHDPDVMFLGEIRDGEAAKSAIDASFSGHVLLSTMHSRDPASAITLLRSMGIKDYEIAASLRMVIGQRILRVLCEHCRKKHEPDEVEEAILDDYGFSPRPLWSAPGCEKCSGTGYRNLLAVFELWRMTDEDYQAIIGHKDENFLRSQLRDREVPSLSDAAFEKVWDGSISLNDAVNVG